VSSGFFMPVSMERRDDISDFKAIYTVRARWRGMDSMKFRFFARPLVLSLLTTLLVLSRPLIVIAADALQPGSSAVVSGTDGTGLRVRSGPGPTNNVLTTLKDGERVEITGAPQESNGLIWYPVKSARATGWSNSQYLTVPASDGQDILASARSKPVTADASAAPEMKMFQMLNEARTSRGLNPLAWNAELAKASLGHAEDMARRGYMDHTNPEGLDPRDRATKAGYVVPPRSPWLVIETISARPSAEEAMQWLLTNQQHAGVLLRAGWREAGGGYVQGGPYGQFWVMNFGCRPNVLPVFASLDKASLTANITFTNELCTPAGQGDYMGKAVDVQLSQNRDFSGAVWEPFAPSKTIANPEPHMYVKLRDAQGRTSQNDLTIPGVLTAAGQTAPINP
jgi:uncharacterized protein YkwD